MSKLFSTFACLSLLSVPAASLAEQAFPSEGEFSITYTFTTSNPSTSIDVGGGQDLTVNRYLATMINNAGKGFLHLAGGRCTNIRFTNRSDRTVDTRAYCNFRDQDGDTLYARYTTGTPKPAKEISNSWTLVSGTGKYDGIQGGGTDTNSNNLSDQGSYQAVGKLTGSYKIVRSAPLGAQGSHD